MTKYTADDFANAKFAEHPNPEGVDARFAARMNQSTAYPWLLDGVPGNSDAAMARDGWVPVPTKPQITESQYKLALDEDRDPQYVYGFTDAMRLLGGEVIPDPEPTNTDRLRELHQAWINECGDLTLSEYFDKHGVTAPNVKGN